MTETIEVMPTRLDQQHFAQAAPIQPAQRTGLPDAAGTARRAPVKPRCRSAR